MNQLTGGWGNDILLGSKTAGTYKFTDTFGKDTITYSDGQGSLQINRQTLEGTFTSYSDSGAYRLKLTDGSRAELSVNKDSASSTGNSADTPFAINSIALRADSMPGKCQKCLEKTAKNKQNAKSCKKHKLNRPQAGMERASGSIKFVVTASATHHTSEVQHA